MKIIIINLKKSTKKKEKVDKIMKDFEKWSGIKLDYSFFEAVDGKNINYKNLKINNFWYDPHTHLYLTKGEVGCALSHIILWKQFIEICEENSSKNKENQFAMILEDDFIIKNKEVFKEILQINKGNFDFLYLGRKKMVDTKEKKSLLLSNYTKHNVVESVFSYWAIAYIISYNGAKKLYETNNYFFRDNLFPVDEYIPWLFGRNSIYGLKDQNISNNKFLALDPPIITPNNTAFQHSQTYFSYAVPNFRNDIVLITVATEYNDAVKRYIQTANKYGFNPIVLGLNTEWNGGNMIEGIGGGQKINMLNEYLKKKLTKNVMVIFTDSYDVIVNDNINIIISKYKKYYKDKIVFGTECSCWPDETLEKLYPDVTCKNKFLNSGNFMGWRDDLINIMDLDIDDDGDDQLYYTIKYLYSIKTDKKICLDYSNNLFLCLNSNFDYIVNTSKSCIYTTDNIRPTFIHGNGPLSVKRRLNRLSNYCVMGWNDIYQYKSIDFWNKELPSITILYDIEYGINNETLECIKNFNYPKEKIQVLEINFKEQIPHFNNIQENIKNEFIFYINSNIIPTNKDILLDLIYENKNIISPMFVKNNSIFSNFWGDIDNNNYYKRSEDYVDIVNYNKKGLWNVAYISACFLIKKEFFKKDLFTINNDKGDGWDMTMCYNLRIMNIFMWLLNKKSYGKYIDFKDQKIAYIDKYVKTILDKNFQENPKIEEIGENILKISIFNKEFCNYIIKECNNYGEWSKGGEQYFDKRIGNIENYPTQDIQLHEIGLNDIWTHIVYKYISPLIWNYYKYSTKNINLAFVVKYDMEVQRDLKPHHDSSTYTVNVCLNNEFEGGGCRFIKQNKEVVNKDIGSMIIHPGKLTHYHEGIPITDGERYILVSFIN